MAITLHGNDQCKYTPRVAWPRQRRGHVHPPHAPLRRIVRVEPQTQLHAKPRPHTPGHYRRPARQRRVAAAERDRRPGADLHIRHHTGPGRRQINQIHRSNASTTILTTEHRDRTTLSGPPAPKTTLKTNRVTTLQRWTIKVTQRGVRHLRRSQRKATIGKRMARHVCSRLRPTGCEPWSTPRARARFGHTPRLNGHHHRRTQQPTSVREHRTPHISNPKYR